jgi:hypothetical protein
MALAARDLLYEKEPSGRQNKNPDRTEFFARFLDHLCTVRLDGRWAAITAHCLIRWQGSSMS